MPDPGTIGIEASARRQADRLEVVVRLRIPEGVHVEAHEPPDPLLVPTVLKFNDLEVEAVSYPEPTEKDLGLPGPPLLVYQGDVMITAEARGGANVRLVRGTLRYQPCVGGACLPPREEPWQARVAAESGRTPRARGSVRPAARDRPLHPP